MQGRSFPAGPAHQPWLLCVGRHWQGCVVPHTKNHVVRSMLCIVLNGSSP